MGEEIQLRVYGDSRLGTLIYLPGLHGDWTLVGGFRRALGDRVQFVEVTYPRTLTWSLDEYAAAVETGLAKRGIRRGWLLGESFSSQVVWPIAARKQFQVEALILAGGFVRHPMQWGARMAEGICGSASPALLTRILFGYAKVARLRFRKSPETLANIHEFIARRTPSDYQAAKHRLRLVAQSDHRLIAGQVSVPVYALTGLFDPIVPWPWVRRWLKQNCANLREYRILWKADHNVLGTAPQAAADLVVAWMEENT